MPLTGRAVYSRKSLVEGAKALDVIWLRENGFFKGSAGINWTSTWTSRGQPLGKVGYWREDYRGAPLLLWFSYNIRNDGEEWRPLKYSVVLDSTRCHFGGERPWFICPLIVNGRACERRCRFLYLAGSSGYFGCRECHRLTYESRRNHRGKFWEIYGKHADFLEKAMKLKVPRGRKAQARRARREAIATRGMNFGLSVLDGML